jgi:hypothetical protein
MSLINMFDIFYQKTHSFVGIIGPRRGSNAVDAVAANKPESISDPMRSMQLPQTNQNLFRGENFRFNGHSFPKYRSLEATFVTSSISLDRQWIESELATFAT